MLLKSIELVFFTFFIYYLFKKDVRDFFKIKNIPFFVKPESLSLIKTCSNCSSNLKISDSFNLSFGKEIKCSNCKSFLRADRSNPTVEKSIFFVISLIFTIGIILDDGNEGSNAISYILITSVLSYFVGKLIYSNPVVFNTVPGEYFGTWTRGGAAGASFEELGDNISLKKDYQTSYRFVKKIMKESNIRIESESEEHKFILGRLTPFNNSAGDLCLFNFESNDQETKISFYVKPSEQLFGFKIPPRLPHALELIKLSLEGKHKVNIGRKVWIANTIPVLSILLGLSIWIGSIALYEEEGVNVFSNTLDGSIFFATWVLLFAGFSQLLGRRITDFLYKHDILVKKVNERESDPFGKAKALIFSVSTVFPVMFYFLNSHFDKSIPKEKTAYLGNLEYHADEKNNEDYCYLVYLTKKYEDRIGEEKYCFSEGYQFLKPGEEVKLLVKNGFLGVSWAKKIELARYSSFESLIKATGSAAKVGHSEVDKLKLQDKNFRSIASTWDQKCEKNDSTYCRLSAYGAQSFGKEEEYVNLLKKSCDLGDSKSCFDLYATKKLSKNGEKKYLKDIKESCDRKDPESCHFWAQTLWAESGYKNHEEVKPFLEIACEKDVFSSCADLALINLARPSKK